MSLPKAHRLRHRQDFNAVYQVGSRQSSPNLALRALRLKPTIKASLTLEPANAPTQIGISISQKVSKRAVIRNRIKRQLKASFRALLPQVAAGWQLVVVVKPSATQCSYEQFLQELEQLLCRAKVINGR
ncbi:MAG: ribonuclease P protein component [Pegethrix bostrychoides GSE-TBD4-15B]|uniref:Ribonuclease P protein component n=1 Tax=Pegethrix bostrychoides GSE-TBD4-15B TaxID=2839662 RepID=A0A951PDN6_9CYAN|nr:ribonuclease P protein component [Pegethrix bostrychoides GSE-TBD4-15B]